MTDVGICEAELKSAFGDPHISQLTLTASPQGEAFRPVSFLPSVFPVILSEC